MVYASTWAALVRGTLAQGTSAPCCSTMRTTASFSTMVMVMVMAMEEERVGAGTDGPLLYEDLVSNIAGRKVDGGGGRGLGGGGGGGEKMYLGEEEEEVDLEVEEGEGVVVVAEVTGVQETPAAAAALAQRVRDRGGHIQQVSALAPAPRAASGKRAAGESARSWPSVPSNPISRALLSSAGDL